MSVDDWWVFTSRDGYKTNMRDGIMYIRITW